MRGQAPELFDTEIEISAIAVVAEEPGVEADAEQTAEEVVEG